jgi:Head domain of trimeric autotransporter adhesin
MKTKFIHSFATPAFWLLANFAHRAKSLRSALFCLLSFVFFNLSSQVPQGFNYQAIARDGSGNPIINATMQVKIGILSDTIANTLVWEELFNPVRTNAFGMFTIIIGTGVKQSGSATIFSDIDWTKTPLFLRSSIYYPGSWKIMGTTKLESVPYSMVAGNLEGTVPLLSVKGNTNTMDSALFVVRNNTGQIVFAVYNEGVRIYVDDGVAKGSPKGGFAIGGFGTSKGTSQPYFVVAPDSIRAYLNNNPVKAVKGGFAIGGFDRSKSANQNFLTVSNDSIRMYIDDNLTSKASKGGFAIGSFDKSKGGNINYLNVSTDSSGIINPSQNRILWYPLKDAFLTGKVLIEKPDSVGINSFASGYESKASGQYSQALGYQSIARGAYSTSIGFQSIANQDNSFAFGQWAQAKNQESYAFGRGALATGYRSFAFGSSGVDSLGRTTGVAYAKGDYSFAIGQGSQSLGFGAFALGLADTAKGNYSMALGYETYAGNAAISIGYQTKASDGSTALGINTLSELGSTAMGANTIASGRFSTSMGYITLANGDYSLASGLYCIASGVGSIAMGQADTASGWTSFAMGTYNKASGIGSAAIGESSKASGYTSTAIGNFTTASGNWALATGVGSTASGVGSTAMDIYTKAIGYASTTMGNQTMASGSGSTAIGLYSRASGDNSTSMGAYTKAKPFASLAIGQYNDTTCSTGGNMTWTSTDPVFIIGNGTADNTRNNALTVLKNGNVGIGITSPGTKLAIAGLTGSATGSTLIINGNNVYYLTSKKDSKKDIEPLTDNFEKILQAQPVSFTDKATGMRGIGYIAEDFEKEGLQNLLVYEDGKLVSLRYDLISVYNLEIIKEQQKQIESYKSEIQSLQEKFEQIGSQQKAIDELRTLVNTLIANQTSKGNN